MTEDYKYIFSRRLKSYRERKGISKHTLAELCGLSKDMVAKYERGECMPSIGSLLVLANALGVDFSEFFKK